MTLDDYTEGKARELEGNWKRFPSFGWHDQPEDASQWCIVYTHNRDSGLLEQSNAHAIGEAMRAHLKGDDCNHESHNHFACGWVEGYSIRVYESGTMTPTAAFRAWCELQLRLEDYPSLDDDYLSGLEYEAAIEAIGQTARKHVQDNPPDGWEGAVYHWLSENEPSALDYSGDLGASPTEEQVKAALKALRLMGLEGTEGAELFDMLSDMHSLEAEDLIGATLAHLERERTGRDDCTRFGSEAAERAAMVLREYLAIRYGTDRTAVVWEQFRRTIVAA